MVECSFSGPKDLTPEEQHIRAPGKWKLFIDGSVFGQKCGVGLILTSPEGFEICQASRFTFSLTNNEAEYEALLAGMALAKNLGVKHLRVLSDFILVIKHFSGEYMQRDPRTYSYATKVRENSLFLESFELSQIGSENNSRADALYRLASTKTQNLTGSIYLTEVKASTIDKKQYMEIHQGITWMTLIRGFLGKNVLPLDRKDAQKIRYQASSYAIIGGKLYRQSATEPLLRCLDFEEQRLALERVHEGMRRTLGGKVVSL